MSWSFDPFSQTDLSISLSRIPLRPRFNPVSDEAGIVTDGDEL